MSSCFNNKRYKMMEVRDSEYVPDVEDDFPEDDPFVHKLVYEDIYNEVFDENYPYLDHSWKWKIHHWICLLQAHFICFWVSDQFI